MRRNSEVLLATLQGRGEPHLAAGLTGDLIAITPKQDGPDLLPTGHAGVSHRDHLVARQMQPDEARAICLVKVASNRVADHFPQFRPTVGLREK